MKDQMSKYKYQVIALGAAIVVGILIGSVYTGGNKNKEILKLQEQHGKELEKLNKHSLKEIEQRELRIEEFEKLVKKDSALISKLQQEILQDGVRVEERRRKVRNLTNEEKKKWLIDRYSTTP